ncbi:MAG: DUF192 domain-containing protein [Candidatus Micrarchaeota archaeon]|nr:DUF192 domain-containing protein [Candidatus Micrarchaeota archaeon]MDE1823906.1 DUF192 domain-containing protein [Candidatus Micrarchaeota archaeon]MDE1849320.1 DUF192 domain-containing protein [Candidatus Micrarchaeota archaeon]
MEERVVILLLAVAALFSVVSLASYLPSSSKSQWHFTVGGKTYAATYAETNQAGWERGLMNQTNISNGTFALFVFNRHSIWPFWMKNTYVPLDIIWINNSKVVYVANAVPCIQYDKNQSDCTLYVPTNASNYAIEARSGFAAMNNITIGSEISIGKN